jgi:hypothetical protein
MIIFTEMIVPPSPIVTEANEDTMRLAEDLAHEDPWVSDFIDRLAGVIREMRH